MKAHVTQNAIEQMKTGGSRGRSGIWRQSFTACLYADEVFQSVEFLVSNAGDAFQIFWRLVGAI